ncbi:MAG: HAD-IB family hydrolase [Bifidobacteriaceae bacterium]|nr:HAD-IB family hydrolase [Bifidobacteriaceae bacterium]
MTESLGQAPPAQPAGQSTAPGVVAALFDVDNTILRGASVFHLGVGLFRRRLLSLRDIVRFSRMNLRYMLFGESDSGVAAARTHSLDAIRGQPVAQMVAVAEEVWDEVLAARVFPGAKDLVDEHLARGHEVWLVSASPTAVVDLLAARVGATGGLGTEAEAVDGYFTGRLVGGLLHGPAKATAAKALAQARGFDLEACYAYGDSANDIPILSLVGHPCGINPDRRLRRYCRQRRWPMREFRDQRRAVRRSLRAVSRVGAVWALWVVIQRFRRGWRRRPGRR